jgi:hypothetical protein
MATGSVSAIDQDNWQLISTTSFNSSSQYTLQTGMAGAYKSLMVAWTCSSKEGAAVAQIQFNTDTTSGNYGSNCWWSEATVYQTSLTGLVIDGYNAITGPTGGYAIFDNCNSTTVPVITREVGGYSASGGAGAWFGYAAVTSVNFRSITGNAFVTGTVKLFGIAS